MRILEQVQARCSRCGKDAVVSCSVRGRGDHTDTEVRLEFVDCDVMCRACIEEVAGLEGSIAASTKALRSPRYWQGYHMNRVELLHRQAGASFEPNRRRCTRMNDPFAAETRANKEYQLWTWSLGDGFAMLDGYESRWHQRNDEKG